MSALNLQTTFDNIAIFTYLPCQSRSMGSLTIPFHIVIFILALDLRYKKRKRYGLIMIYICVKLTKIQLSWLDFCQLCQARTIWKEETWLTKCLYHMTHRQVCWSFSWLMIAIWGPSPLYSVIPLNRLSWVICECRLIKAWRTSQLAVFFSGFCLSSWLLVWIPTLPALLDSCNKPSSPCLF